MIDLSIYNQQGPVIVEEYISSESFQFLIQDTFTINGNINPLGNSFVQGQNLDTFDIAASMQGNHALTVIRAEHDVYDTDTFDIAASMQGNHALTTIRVEHDVYDTDTFDISASMQGNHTMAVTRIDHDVYDTDTFDMTASMQGNHTLS